MFCSQSQRRLTVVSLRCTWTKFTPRTDLPFGCNVRYNHNDGGIKTIEFVNINPPSHHSHKQSLSSKHGRKQRGNKSSDLILQNSQSSNESELISSNNDNVSSMPWKARTMTLTKHKYIIPEILIRQIEAVTGATIKQEISNDSNNNNVKPFYDIEITGTTHSVNLAMQQYIQYFHSTAPLTIGAKLSGNVLEMIGKEMQCILEAQSDFEYRIFYLPQSLNEELPDVSKRTNKIREYLKYGLQKVEIPFPWCNDMDLLRFLLIKLDRNRSDIVWNAGGYFWYDIPINMLQSGNDNSMTSIDSMDVVISHGNEANSLHKNASIWTYQCSFFETSNSMMNTNDKNDKSDRNENEKSLILDESNKTEISRVMHNWLNEFNINYSILKMKDENHRGLLLSRDAKLWKYMKKSILNEYGCASFLVGNNIIWNRFEYNETLKAKEKQGTANNSKNITQFLEGTLKKIQKIDLIKEETNVQLSANEIDEIKSILSKSDALYFFNESKPDFILYYGNNKYKSVFLQNQINAILTKNLMKNDEITPMRKEKKMITMDSSNIDKIDKIDKISKIDNVDASIALNDELLFNLMENIFKHLATHNTNDVSNNDKLRDLIKLLKNRQIVFYFNHSTKAIDIKLKKNSNIKIDESDKIGIINGARDMINKIIDNCHKIRFDIRLIHLFLRTRKHNEHKAYISNIAQQFNCKIEIPPFQKALRRFEIIKYSTTDVRKSNVNMFGYYWSNDNNYQKNTKLETFVNGIKFAFIDLPMPLSIIFNDEIERQHNGNQYELIAEWQIKFGLIDVIDHPVRLKITNMAQASRIRNFYPPLMMFRYWVYWHDSKTERKNNKAIFNNFETSIWNKISQFACVDTQVYAPLLHHLQKNQFINRTLLNRSNVFISIATQNAYIIAKNCEKSFLKEIETKLESTINEIKNNCYNIEMFDDSTKTNNKVLFVEMQSNVDEIKSILYDSNNVNRSSFLWFTPQTYESMYIYCTDNNQMQLVKQAVNGILNNSIVITLDTPTAAETLSHNRTLKPLISNIEQKYQCKIAISKTDNTVGITQRAGDKKQLEDAHQEMQQLLVTANETNKIES